MRRSAFTQPGVAPDVISSLPGGEVAVGAAAREAFWCSLLQALPAPQVEIEHLVSVPRPGRATAAAMRWRYTAVHTGPGRYGAPTGRPVHILGITHLEIESGVVVREWVLIDEVATWMQMLSPRTA
ncbi:MAG: ester cyclase [Betaproteobacteria bacterium]